jgi:hypothetical protein
MADGFRSQFPPGTTLLQGVGLNTQQTVPFSVNTLIVDMFQSLEVALFATTNGGAGGASGLLQLQFLWFDGFSPNGNLVWVDTCEIVFDTVPNFSGKRAFVRTPVRGRILLIVSNGGTNAPTNPVCTVNIYGSTVAVPGFIIWQDTLNFSGTDNIIGQQTVAVEVVGPGATTTTLICPPASGPLTVSFRFNISGNGGVFFQSTFGSITAIGLPQLGVSATLGAGQYSGFMTGVFTARRPLIVNLLNNSGAGINVTAHTLVITRDEP